VVQIQGLSEPLQVHQARGEGVAAVGPGDDDLAPRDEATCLQQAQVVEVVGGRDAEAARQLALEAALASAAKGVCAGFRVRFVKPLEVMHRRVRQPYEREGLRGYAPEGVEFDIKDKGVWGDNTPEEFRNKGTGVILEFTHRRGLGFMHRRGFGVKLPERFSINAEELGGTMHRRGLRPCAPQGFESLCTGGVWGLSKASGGVCRFIERKGLAVYQPEAFGASALYKPESAKRSAAQTRANYAGR
jgi:hypothetical protein